MTDSSNTFKFEQAMVPASLFKTGFEFSTYSGSDQKALREMYSIALLDISKPSFDVPVIEGLDPHAAGGSTGQNKAEHFFTMPPKVVDVTEPYTSKVVPTQNGGIYVESHGCIIREVRIQGTSGLRPNKPIPVSVDLLGGLGVLSGPANSLLGPVINSIDNLIDTFSGTGNARGLDASERTGYDDVMKLRNIFRAYSDYKQNNDKSSKTVMVWRDIRTADYWIVEPREFKLVQDAKSPLTYTYSIALKTLSRLEYQAKVSKDPQQAFRDSRAFFKTMQDSVKAVTGTLTAVAGSIDRLTSVGVFVQDTVMNPLIQVVRGVSAISNASQSLSPALRQNWVRLNSRLDEALNVLSASLAPNVSGFSQASWTPGAPANALTGDELEIAESFYAVTNALRSAQRATRQVLLHPTSQRSVQDIVNQRKETATRQYNRPLAGGSRSGTVPTTGGDKTYLGNQTLGAGLARICVEPRDTIQTLAQRALGNRGAWKILVLINDLKPPYVSTSGAPRTAAPGECILYPTNDVTGISINEVNPNDDERDQQGQDVNTQIERSYGRDIRLQSDFQNRTDFSLEAGGDLATIQGIPNVKQGIRLKFSTEQGTLTVHPNYGILFPIGSKMTPLSFNEFRLNAIGTIQSDPRILNVKRFDFFAQGDVLAIGTELILKNSRDVTTTAFRAGTF